MAKMKTSSKKIKTYLTEIVEAWLDDELFLASTSLRWETRENRSRCAKSTAERFTRLINETPSIELASVVINRLSNKCIADDDNTPELKDKIARIKDYYVEQDKTLPAGNVTLVDYFFYPKKFKCSWVDYKGKEHTRVLEEHFLTKVKTKK